LEFAQPEFFGINALWWWRYRAECLGLTDEARLKDGKIEFIKVLPEEGRNDIVSIFQE
jgi:hypothetical protein